MRKIAFESIVYTFAILFALVMPQPIFAHGGEPRLEISVEQVNPGGLVEVRGADFDYEELVVLSLARSHDQMPLMSVTTDAEGTFTQNIVLPADLPAGQYNFLARSKHHTVTSSIITVWGTAIQDQEDNGIRDQSDVQLEPMLTIAPNTSSAPLPQDTVVSPPASKGISPVLIYSILLGVGIVALFSLKILKKRSGSQS